MIGSTRDAENAAGYSEATITTVTKEPVRAAQARLLLEPPDGRPHHLALCVGPGLNSSVAALLHTPNHRHFVKALPADHRWVWTQAREAEIARNVRPVAPRAARRVVQHG
jgi:hypothetical protein